MKTVEEKAEMFVFENIKCKTQVEFDHFKSELALLLKQQDRDTRHACIDSVNKCDDVNEMCYGDERVHVANDDVTAEIMNTKAV